MHTQAKRNINYTACVVVLWCASVCVCVCNGGGELVSLTVCVAWQSVRSGLRAASSGGVGGGQHVLGSCRGSRMELPLLQRHRCTRTVLVQFPLHTTVNITPLLPSDTQDFQVCVCLSTCVLKFLTTQILDTVVKNPPIP